MTARDELRVLFDEIVAEAVRELPGNFRGILKDLPIVIEDEPTPEQLEELELADPGALVPDSEASNLCGLYFGPTLAERGPTSSPPEGSGILLFRGPLLRLAEGDVQILREEIHVTLLHELAHYLGFEEDDLERLGYD